MFTDIINRILESERDFGSNRQEEVTTPDVIEEKSAEIQEEIKIPKKYQNDIEALRDMYGENFKTGLCINLTLKQALEIMPRERLRVDAYTGVISFLKAKMGITLNIKSQKSKL